MNDDRTRGVLSVIVVTGFIVTSVVIALTPILGGYPKKDYVTHLATFANLYSGIFGTIIGYYFGKVQNAQRSSTGFPVVPRKKKVESKKPPQENP